MKEFTRLECIAKTNKIISSLTLKIEAYESRLTINSLGWIKIRVGELSNERAYYQKILSLISPTK